MPRYSKMKDDDRGPLGALLHSARQAAGFNVETCAGACGLSVSYLHMAEQGRRTPALAQMLTVADAYLLDRRRACWGWVLSQAPAVLPYMVSHADVASDPMLSRHFSEQYSAQQAAKEAARKAALTTRRTEQARSAQMKRAKDVIGGVLPGDEQFEHKGYVMTGPLGIQQQQAQAAPEPVTEPAPKPRRTR